MNEAEDNIFEEEEAEEDGILLCIGEDGILHKYEPKPGIMFDFETEDELKAFMEKLIEMKLLKDGDKASVKNVSENFFEGFTEINL